MASYKKGKKGQVTVDFEEMDLTFSKVALTKNTLSEIVDQSEIKFEFKNIHECDSAGLQTLLFFTREIKERGGKVLIDELPSQIEALCQLFGIHEMSFFDTTVGGNDV